MANNAMLLLCAFLGLLSVCFAAGTSGYTTKLEIHCDRWALHHIVNDNAPRNVTDFCGVHFYANAYGLSTLTSNDPTATWTATARILSKMDGKELLTSSVTETASVLTMDDVTMLFKSIPPMDVHVAQAGGCDNIPIITELSLSDGNIAYTGADTTTLWCDFSGINLEVQATGTSGGVVHLDSNDTVVLPSGVTVSATVEANLPTLANDGCYFAVAFFSRYAPINCSSGSPMEEGTDIHFDDHIVGNPVCLKTATDVQNFNIHDALDQARVPKGVCGTYYLVLLLDPLHSAGTEHQLCDNSVAFEYDIDCSHDDATMDYHGARCEMVQNGWNSKDMRMNLYENWNDGRMLQYEDNHWRTRQEYDMDEVERIGYGSLKVLGAYLKDEVMACETDNSIDPTAELDNLEGHNDEAVFDKTLTLASLQLYEAQKTILDGLATDDSTAQSAEHTAKNDYNTEKQSQPTDFMGKLEREIKLAAYNATIFLAGKKYIDHDTYMVQSKIQEIECSLPHELQYYEENDRYLYGPYASTDQSHIEHMQHEIIRIVGKVTKAALIFKALHPDFTCLEKMLKNLIYHVKQRNDGTPTDEMSRSWLFDQQVRKNVKLRARSNDTDEELQHCGEERMNKCMKKMMLSCRFDRHDCDFVDLHQHDICPTKTIVKYAREHHSHLGLYHISKKFVEMNEHDDHDDKMCNGEPLTPKKEPMVIWRYGRDTASGDHDVVKLGILSVDNKQVCWRKVAVCTCDDCYDDMGPMRRRRRRRKK